MAPSATTTATQTSGAPITASFNYYAGDEPPAVDDVSILTGTSDKVGPSTGSVYSIRESKEEFILDTHGFQVLKHISSLLPPAQSDGAVNFHDEKLVKSAYWPEITALLRDSFGARAVAIINTTVRDIDGKRPESYDPKNPRAKSGSSVPPFYIVHGDYTPAGARSQVRALQHTLFDALGTAPHTTPEERATFFNLHTEVLAAQDAAMKEAGVDEAEWDGSKYTGPRWGMFSVWRPLSTVRRSPLAIMDPRDLTSYADLPRVYRNRPGFVPSYTSSNLLVRPPKDDKQHRWYYLPDQQVDEVYAIKLFDSDSQKEGGPVFGAPHSAFRLEGTSDLPARRSAEVRAIVIW
jgi:hypothetical protein